MDEHAQTAGLSRRDLIKRSAVVGGLVWVVPTVLSSPAGASTIPCPSAQRYAIKHDASQTGCQTPGTNPSPGNCAASDRYTEFNPGCCLEPKLVSFTASNDGTTHTYVLAAGVGFVQGYGKCANQCFRNGDPEAVVLHTIDPVTGIGTVTISCPNLSHSEIIVCLSGSNLPVCT